MQFYKIKGKECTQYIILKDIDSIAVGMDCNLDTYSDDCTYKDCETCKYCSCYVSIHRTFKGGGMTGEMTNIDFDTLQEAEEIAEGLVKYLESFEEA